jgi:hypothetical protein
MRTETPGERGAIFGFKDTQTGVEQLASGHDNDVKTRRDLVTTENLSYQSFGSVSLDGATEFFRRRNPQASDGALVGQHEECGIPPADSSPMFVDLLKLRTPVDPLVGLEPSQVYSSLTVRRFRPFVRRRLSTSLPFFVCMRTRNPCAFRRWRLFGWNVRFPFMSSLTAK